MHSKSVRTTPAAPCRQRLLGLLSGCAFVAVMAGTAQAQGTVIIGGSGNSGVYVNEQLLGGGAGGYGAYGAYGQNPYAQQQGQAGGVYSRPSNLLYPPPSYPQSQVTLQPGQQGYGANAYGQYSAGTPYGSSSSPLYNPYGQPLVPLRQQQGQQPAYPDKVPAAQPQSQLLVPRPAGSTRVPASTPAPRQQTTAVEPAPAPKTPSAPKAKTETAKAPVAIAKAPESQIPPAPAAPEEPKAEQKQPTSETAKAPEPAPKVEAVETESIATPAPPPPAPEVAEEIPAAPAAGTESSDTLSESTAELAPPPPPPAEIEPVQSATVSPTGQLEALQVTFEPDRAELSDAARKELNALADRLLADEELEVQLLAYASGDNDTSGQARRVSLSRALAVRSVLMERGVRSTRMYVRALGNKAVNGNPDRVEIIPVQN